VFNFKASFHLIKKIREEKILIRKQRKKVKEMGTSNGFEGVKKLKKLSNINEEIQYEHPDIPMVAELAWNFILTPLVIYGGLGRLVIVSERKKTF